jgi:hypothetical protein
MKALMTRAAYLKALIIQVMEGRTPKVWQVNRVWVETLITLKIYTVLIVTLPKIMDWIVKLLQVRLRVREGRARVLESTAQTKCNEKLLSRTLDANISRALSHDLTTA